MIHLEYMIDTKRLDVISQHQLLTWRREGRYEHSVVKIGRRGRVQLSYNIFCFQVDRLLLIKETIPLLAILKPLPFPRFPLRKQSIDHFRTYSSEYRGIEDLETMR